MRRLLALDHRLWVRPESVACVRMGADNETFLYLEGNDRPFEVDMPITELLELLATWDEMSANA